MTSLADVMANLQDSERTLATARQWASERVSDCHGVRVWLDWPNHVFRCHRCNQVCEPVLPEKETTVTDDTREKRWTITVCPECWAYRPYSAMDAAHGVKPTCSCWGFLRDEHGVYLGMHGPDLVEIDVVPLERAEKAEAAARDFAEALAEVIERCPGSSKPDIPGLIARSALARHPEYAPERKESQ